VTARRIFRNILHRRLTRLSCVRALPMKCKRLVRL